MNMIPYNAVPDLPYARPSWARAAEIARTLHQRGVLTKLRQSAGQDVEGGCGQLRARDRVQPQPQSQAVHFRPMPKRTASPTPTPATHMGSAAE